MFDPKSIGQWIDAIASTLFAHLPAREWRNPAALSDAASGDQLRQAMTAWANTAKLEDRAFARNFVAPHTYENIVQQLRGAAQRVKAQIPLPVALVDASSPAAGRANSTASSPAP